MSKQRIGSYFEVVPGVAGRNRRRTPSSSLLKTISKPAERSAS